MKSPLQRDFLVINLPNEPTRRFTLRRPTLDVGRADTNDLIIKHESVSRQHARLLRKGDNLFVEDLDSVNGTWVADQPIQPNKPVQVPLGQSFWVGKVEVRFQRQDFTFLVLTVVCAIVMLIFLIPRLPHRNKQEQDPFACNSPDWLINPPEQSSLPAPMKPQPTATSSTGIATETLPAGKPTVAVLLTPTNPIPANPYIYTSLAFLDLPFPYSGDKTDCSTLGSDEEFQKASQRAGQGGRITSFFDHYFPIYPFDPKRSTNIGRESPDKPEAGNVLLFTGELSSYDSYSGHPGYDYSTDGYGNLDTPVCAAASGRVVSVGGDEKTGLRVRINHVVEYQGQEISFQTLYLHLKQDKIFDEMGEKVNQFIDARTRIGTMGNTGPSTGPHLHFEVLRDFNNNGIFESTEVVDPYSYFPGQDYQTDKWTHNSDFLWIHPMRVDLQIPVSGNKNPSSQNGIGGIYSEALNRPTQLCVPPHTLPPRGTLSFSLSLSPPAKDRISIGRSITIAVMDADQKLQNKFDNYVRVMIPFTKEEAQKVKHNDNLKVCRLETVKQGDDYIAMWQPLETVPDFINGIAVGYTDKPGQFALLGEPSQDQFPPEVEITLSGPQNEDGTYYDAVTVSITAIDDQSGIEKIVWRKVDNPALFSTAAPPDGEVRYTYTVTDTITPEGVPDPLDDLDENTFWGPGRFTIIAFAVDKLGNSGDAQPVIRTFEIDPTKKPKQSTP